MFPLAFRKGDEDVARNPDGVDRGDHFDDFGVGLRPAEERYSEPGTG